MTREQAERKIESKKQFISILSEEMKETFKEYSFDKEYLIQRNSRTRLKVIMRMIRRETQELEKLMYNWYSMEV